MKKHIALALTFSFGIAGCGGQADSGAEPVATEQALAAGSNYLALGDSIPFGYNMNANPKVAASQVGYPEVLDAKAGVVTNAACYGESSDSFIDTAQTDHGCKAWRATNAMKVQYANAGQSQLAWAMNYLFWNRNVKTVTVQIGANDLLEVQDACGPDTVCQIANLPGALLRMGVNIGIIIAGLKLVYPGKIVLVNYFAPTKTDPMVPLATQLLNATIASVGAAQCVKVADVYTAFETASAPVGGEPCFAGLLRV